MSDAVSKPSATRPPRAVAVWSWLGVLPFAALAAIHWTIQMDGEGRLTAEQFDLLFISAHALVVYGALIASAVAGFQWALLCARHEAPSFFELGLCLLPGLIGWGAAAAGNVGRFSYALVALGAAVLLGFVLDYRLAGRGAAPEGWLGLRALLTIAVTLCLVASFIRLLHFGA